MTDETRNEIIKSLAYGMEPAEIAELEDVPVVEVEEISHGCADEIAAKSAYMDGRE